MSYFRQSLVNKLGLIVTGLSLACGLFLLPCCADIYKYFILLAAFLFTLFSYKSWDFSTVRDGLICFFTPWIPWYLSIFLLIFIYGIHGFSIYVNALFIMLLVFMVLQSYQLTRKQVITAFALNLLVLSLASIITVLFFGLSDYILGINKNKLIGGASLLTSCCLMELIINSQNYSRKSLLLIALSVFLSLVAIVLTEVRTAILALIAIVPFAVFFKRQNRMKWFFILAVILGIVIALFIFSGRLQQGLNDLLNYQQGNSRTSWGLRIEFWKFAFQAFLAKPILGWGYQPFSDIVAAGIPFGIPNIKEVQHFHSDYFNILATGGLVGILCWLFSVLLLLKKSLHDPVRFILIIAILAIGLSERYWFYNQSVLFLFVSMWVLLHCSSSSESRIKTND